MVGNSFTVAMVKDGWDEAKLRSKSGQSEGCWKEKEG